MNDTEHTAPQAGWILLIHQLPAEPAYLRVKTLRRLKVIGALAMKNSVYVLPDREETREDLHWLRREITAAGGEATILLAQWLEGIADAELEDAFRSERDTEYRALADEMELVESLQDLERARRRLETIEQRDYFAAAGRHRALQALSDARARLGGGAPAPAGVTVKPGGATWVTRAGARIDRLASAWLIRRFIDSAATFRFVASSEEVVAGELRFDMFEGEFTHEGDMCTFETLVQRFGIDIPGVREIGELVHDLDFRDERYGRAETAGLGGIINGVTALHARDEDRVEAGMAVFDSLLAALQSVR